MSTIILILLILIGLALGSFLNVCIYRIPLKKSILFPSSFCPHCGEKIRVRDNIPLLSFVLLKGKCRKCKAKISLQYPLVEFITSALIVITYLRFGSSWEFVSKSILVLSLVVIFFIDLKHRIIPDVITLPGIALGFFFSFFVESPSPRDSLIGIMVGGVMFYLSAVLGELLFKKESMGGGDIKLAIMLGAFLGWQKILLVFLLSAASGAMVGGIVLFFSKEVKETKMIPFGPFLALGSILAIFLGDMLISAYIRAFF
jgi:leader peptidase (prepilin peptidase)/N-methyltransferase